MAPPEPSEPGTPSPPGGTLDRRALLRAGAAALVLGAGALPPLAAAAPGADRRLRALARSLDGDLVTRSSPGYSAARLLFNTRFDGMRPLAIAYCETVDDVAKAVYWAKQHGVRIAARSGGHSYGGYSSTSGLVVDVTRLARVRAGPGATATVGAGARLIDVYDELSRSGVTIPAGSCPTVGIAGLALGGGHGFSARKLGLTCDAIEELTIVTADGRVLQCSEREHADLYWACRGGGGGNFGIVTEFVFRTSEASPVTTYAIAWPWASARDVVATWQDWAPEAPEELTSIVAVHATAEPSEQPRLTSAGQFHGSESELRSLLQPLIDIGTPTRVSVVTRSHMAAVHLWAACGSNVEACHPSWTGLGMVDRGTFRTNSAYANDPLPAEAIDFLVRSLEARQGVGSGYVLIDAYGGAVNRIPSEATAFVHRDSLCSLQYVVTWRPEDPYVSVAAGLAWLRSLHTAMQPHVSGFAYQNYIDPDLAGWKHAYYGSNYRRLVNVKRRYDRDNLFRFRQSIPPHG